MLLDPRTPLIIGVILILLVIGVLAVYSPMPGDLSSAHAQIHDISKVTSCKSCHDDAGMDQGCLGCHSEIRAQLVEKRGYHDYLMSRGDAACSDCHAEHAGEEFALVNDMSWGSQTPAVFSHPHVRFRLTDRHTKLDCETCHTRDEPYHMPGFEKFTREQTFLGVEQDCISCHEDPHADGLSGDCGACHGQEAFHPAPYFDHGRSFPLVGGHVDVDCTTCHEIPEPGTPQRPLPFPFDSPRGRSCVECHESPHLAAFTKACDACHPIEDDHWTSAVATMTPEKHVPTGFRLLGAHAEVACGKCHPSHLSFRERHPDPTDPHYTRRETECDGCHTEPHGGQFVGRYERCVDCHDNIRFNPPAFGLSDHARNFELLGAHAAVACTSCHLPDESTGVRQFVGTSDACKSCHADPHAGQFAKQISIGDCDVCHSSKSDTFRIRPFDHALRTGYALRGAHTRADCKGCHVAVPFEVAGHTVEARRFKGTPTTCHSCHRDVHRGQFKEHGTCTACHTSIETWREVVFDHNRQSDFPLEGAHARLDCSRCHVKVRLEDGSDMVRYRPLGTQCRDCHDILPFAAPRSR